MIDTFTKALLHFGTVPQLKDTNSKVTWTVSGNHYITSMDTNTDSYMLRLNGTYKIESNVIFNKMETNFTIYFKLRVANDSLYIQKQLLELYSTKEFNKLTITLDNSNRIVLNCKSLTKESIIISQSLSEDYYSINITYNKDLYRFTLYINEVLVGNAFHSFSNTSFMVMLSQSEIAHAFIGFQNLMIVADKIVINNVDSITDNILTKLTFNYSIISDTITTNKWNCFGQPLFVRSSHTFGKALQLNGTTYIELVDVKFNDNFTLEGWFQYDNKIQNVSNRLLMWNDISLYRNSQYNLTLALADNQYIIDDNTLGTSYNHFAISYDVNSSRLRLFLNGICYLDLDYQLNINYSGTLTFGYSCIGIIEEIRISSGIMRYINDFDISTTPFNINVIERNTISFVDFDNCALCDKRGMLWSVFDHTLITQGLGMSNKALQLSKSSQYLFSNDVVFGNNSSIDFWIYVDKPQGTIFDIIDNNESVLSLIISDNKFLLNMQDSFTKTFSSVEYRLLHLALILNNTTVSVYINNVFKHTITLNKYIARKHYKIIIGNSNNLDSQFIGRLSMFRILDYVNYSDSFLLQDYGLVNFNSHTSVFLPFINSALQDYSLYKNIWTLVNQDNIVNLIDNNHLVFIAYRYVKTDYFFNLGGQDFSIECRLYINNLTKSGKIIQLISDLTSITFERLDTSDKLQLIVSNAEEKLIVASSGYFNTIIDCAISYNFGAKRLKLFINGQFVGSIKCYLDRRDFYCILGDNINIFIGFIEKLHIVDGIDLWNGNHNTLLVNSDNIYTDVDNNTIALLHFDSHVCNDASGRLWQPLSFATNDTAIIVDNHCYFKEGNTSYLKSDVQLDLQNIDFTIYVEFSVNSITNNSSILQLIGFDPVNLEHSLSIELENELLTVKHKNSKLVTSKVKIQEDVFYKVHILYENVTSTIKMYVNGEYQSGLSVKKYCWTFSSVIAGSKLIEGQVTNCYQGVIDNISIFNKLTVDDFNYNSTELLDNNFVCTDCCTEYLYFDKYPFQTLRGKLKILLTKGIVLTFNEGNVAYDHCYHNEWHPHGTIKVSQSELYDSIFDYHNDGNPDNFIYSNNLDFDSLVNNDFTLDFWIKPNLQEIGVIISNHPDDYWKGFSLLLISNWLRLTALWDNEWHEINLLPIESTVWSHVALIRESSVIKIYKNGMWVVSLDVDNFDGLSETTFFGYRKWLNKSFSGRISQFRLLPFVVWTDNFTPLNRPLDGSELFYDIVNNRQVVHLYPYTFMFKQFIEDQLFTLSSDFTINFNCTFMILFNVVTNIVIIQDTANDHIVRIYTDNQNVLINVNNTIVELFSLTPKKMHKVDFTIVYVSDKHQLFCYVEGLLVKVINQIYFSNLTVNKLTYNQDSKNVLIINEFSISKDIKKISYLVSNDLLKYYDTNALLVQDFHNNELVDKTLNAWSIVNYKNNNVISSNLSYSSRFGSSAYFNGIDQALRSVDEVDFSSSNQFTIDFWMYLNDDRYSTIVSLYNVLNSDYLNISVENNKVMITTTSYNTSLTAQSMINFKNNLIHFALTYNKPQLKCFVNGMNISANWSIELPLKFSNIYLGVSHTFQNYLHGYISEFRISNIVRWLSNFKPEVSKYVNSTTDTKLIYKVANKSKIVKLITKFDKNLSKLVVADSDSGNNSFVNLVEQYNYDVSLMLGNLSPMIDSDIKQQKLLLYNIKSMPTTLDDSSDSNIVHVDIQHVITDLIYESDEKLIVLYYKIDADECSVAFNKIDNTYQLLGYAVVTQNNIVKNLYINYSDYLGNLLNATMLEQLGLAIISRLLSLKNSTVFKT